jgi:hypothetical protein
MWVDKNMTIQDIRNEFMNLFPSLKIEFYTDAHENHEGNTKRNEILHDMKLGAVSPSLQENELVLDGEMTVKEFEATLKNDFGLNVQVFRKSKGIWLQTTSTDDWSLNVQNNKGYRSTLDHHIEEFKMKDLDLD